jgi:hypothetical protein
MTAVALDTTETSPAIRPYALHDIGRRFGNRYLALLALVLMGYALDGRGFAYLGFPPIFVGEIALLTGVVAFGLAPRWRSLLAMPVVWVLLAFCGWGLLRTLPFVGEYQIDALRDAVVWGYATFAVVVAALLIAEPARLPMLLRWYGRFIPVFLTVIPFVCIAYRFYWPELPRWPWAEVPIIFVKEADAMVHLGGIVAFWVLVSSRRVPLKWLVMMTICVGFTAVIDRSGFLAFAAVLGICTLARPRSVVLWKMLTVVILAGMMLWATSFRYAIPGGKGREVSVDQFITNLASVTGDAGSDGLDSTKEWRLQWWGTIVDYTLHGPYFWGGKGFGVNLADDDGFQVGNHTLRSPHNFHMTVLARMGVVGAVLWIALLVAWAITVMREYVISRRAGERTWSGVFLFVAAFWLAFLINGAFDVYLEGPPGGIWFWSVFGLGLGAVWVHRNAPGVLSSTRTSDHTDDTADNDAKALYTDDIVLMLDNDRA